jgi:hypothetical protein
LSAKTRSRAYPALDLREAIDVLRQLVEVHDFREGDRDLIARALGHASGLSGIAGRKVASLVHFGLMERRESLYRLTALSHYICNSVSEESLRSALRRAFLTPTLFRELVDEYRPTGAIPRYFAQALRNYGVTETAKHEVARIFMVSGEYAGILAADGAFLDEKSGAPKPTVADRVEPAEIPQAAVAHTPTLLPTEPDNIQVFRFFLTDRKMVEMKFPAGLNEDDITLIKKQIEFLELQIQISRPAAPIPFRRPSRAGESA